MTEAMPFLQKAILLSYDPRPLRRGGFYLRRRGRKGAFTGFMHNACSDGRFRLSSLYAFCICAGVDRCMPGRAPPCHKSIASTGAKKLFWKKACHFVVFCFSGVFIRGSLFSRL